MTILMSERAARKRQATSVLHVWQANIEQDALDAGACQLETGVAVAASSTICPSLRPS
jgi:hypothetical protein